MIKKKISQYKSDQRGFTLIELLITVAILAMLMIILIIAWRGQIDKANDAQRKADLKRLSIAFENYYNDNQCYPVTTILNNCGGNELTPYLNNIPCDPSFHLPYCYVGDGTDCGQSFKLLAPLTNAYDPIIEKLLCHGQTYCGHENECAQPSSGYEGFNFGISSSNIQVFNPDASPIPSASPSISPSPSPSSSPYLAGGFACDKNGLCNSNSDPLSNGCPTSYDDMYCNGECSNPQNWCP